MFSTSFNNKSNACGKNDAKYLSIYVILHVKHQKVPILAIFTWFLILGKIQDGGQDGDEILQHIKTSGEGFYRSPPPPKPLLYHGKSMNLRVRPRVKNGVWTKRDSTKQRRENLS